MSMWPAPPSLPLRMLALILAIGLVWGGTGCRKGRNSSDSGVGPEAGTDLRQWIETGIASGEKQITIPPGSYRVSAQNREHLLLKNLRDTIIIADGVEMICTETTRAITIENCENLTLQGLTIDYDPLPFTQGRIVEISPDRRHLKVEIIPGYPLNADPVGSMEVFNPATRRLRGNITYFNTQATVTDEGRVTLTTKEDQAGMAGEQIGDIAVFRSSSAAGGSIPHTIMATDSKNLTMKNVTLFASNTFGFFENRCDGSQYIDCRLTRRSQESDPILRDEPRLRSGNADAFHSKNARIGPLYLNCQASFMGDDAIAINGDFHFITESTGSTLRVLAKHTMNMLPGDEVQIFTFDGVRLPNHSIISLERDGSITGKERALLARSSMNTQLRDSALGEAWRVTLDGEVKVPPGSVICSADGIGNGFAIRDCQLGFNRARGILVKAGRGEISGNTIEGTAITGILISPEFWWLEAGFADNLTIANNQILDSGGMGIAVVAVGGDGALAPAGAFRNITIRDNIITGGAAPGLLLTSIRGLTEESNQVEIDADKSLFSWQIGPWGRDGIKPVMKVNLEE